MKCPKCGYLGFETTDRCRNCQYDFSLAPFRPETELTLHDRGADSPGADLDLPPLARGTETPSTSLDLDRLFGEAEPVAPAPLASSTRLEAARTYGIADEPTGADDDADDALSEYATTDADIPREPLREPEADDDEDSLPFDDVPIVPPPAARTPLAVRRSTPELPRNRPRTSRMPRTDSLNLEPASDAKGSAAAAAVSETIASLLETPSLVARVGAAVIDAVLLTGINLAVIYLTLRVTGLQNSMTDLRLLPPIPFVGFLAVLTFGYVAAFTVGGGQTIGKMMLNLRVIGDDGRPVDAAGGVLRAAGCMLVPMTLGVSYLPAIFTSDHRALHDRIAGTRVVRE